MSVAAFSRSASAATIAGVLPPSSSDDLAMLVLEYSSTRRPAATPPVSVIMATLGCVHKACASSCPMVRMFTTPGGSLASSTAWAISNALQGVLLLGRTTTVLPVISAGAILRSKVYTG